MSQPGRAWDEATLIARIAELARGTERGASGLVLGIGDDAAILTPPEGHDLVATVDDQVEGVHFRRGPLALEDVGWRAAAASLSDLAAMGARPAGALIAVMVPRDVAAEDVVRAHRGATDLLRSVGCPLVGGNVSRAPRGLAMSITALGWVERGRAFLRDGARPGDVLLVTGAPGAARRLAALGVATGRPRRVAGPRPALAAVNERFLRPRPRIAEARWLQERGVVRAAIDLSDGLALDASRLAAASGAGLLLERAAIAAIADDAPLGAAARALGDDPTDTCLRGGEDYELLIAVAPGEVGALRAAAAGRLDVELRPVGRLVGARGAWIEEPDGARVPIDPTTLGFDHLRPESDAPSSRHRAGGASPRGERRRAEAALDLPWFFYGTLASASFRARLCGRTTDLGAARVRGRPGKIAGGYRAIVADPCADSFVEGRLVRLDAPPGGAAAVARRLDEYEGEPYRRAIVPAIDDAGATRLAYGYVVPPGRAGEVTSEPW